MSWEEKLIKENRKQHYREELKSGHYPKPYLMGFLR